MLGVVNELYTGGQSPNPKAQVTRSRYQCLPQAGSQLSVCSKTFIISMEFFLPSQGSGFETWRREAQVTLAGSHLSFERQQRVCFIVPLIFSAISAWQRAPRFTEGQTLRATQKMKRYSNENAALGGICICNSTSSWESTPAVSPQSRGRCSLVLPQKVMLTVCYPHSYPHLPVLHQER